MPDPAAAVQGLTLSYGLHSRGRQPVHRENHSNALRTTRRGICIPFRRFNTGILKTADAADLCAPGQSTAGLSLQIESRLWVKKIDMSKVVVNQVCFTVSLLLLGLSGNIRL